MDGYRLRYSNSDIVDAAVAVAVEVVDKIEPAPM